MNPIFFLLLAVLYAIIGIQFWLNNQPWMVWVWGCYCLSMVGFWKGAQ